MYGAAMITAITTARLLHVVSVTDDEVPEKKGVAAPIHGISVEATPTTHSSFTAWTGLPFSSLSPFPRMYCSLASGSVALSWSILQPLVSSFSPVVS